MVSGLAPGRLAVTSKVGRSTLGRSLTANSRYATVPKRAIAAIIKLVAIGRSINVWEIFIGMNQADNSVACLHYRSHRFPRLLQDRPFLDNRRHVRINNRGQVEGHQLRKEQTAHH